MKRFFKIIRYINSFSLSGKISALILFFIIIIAIFAPVVSPYSPDKSSGPALSPPESKHIFGTDDLGYDIWSQIAHGARVSLIIGIGTALLASFGGGVVGIIAGYKGGFLDKGIMRIIDIMIVLPNLPLMIILAAFLGPSLVNIIIVLSFFSWIRPARIVRSQVLMLKEMDYIKSAETYGASALYLLRKHFLPEIFPIIAVNMIRLSSRAIVAEAGLSFLGLGDPSSKSWGLIIHHATNFQGIYYTPFWKWWLLYPWLILIILVLALAFLSKELEKVYSLRK
ncbi:MAG: ABC transporter permease [Halanaerobiaceae bacterium]